MSAMSVVSMPLRSHQTDMLHTPPGPYKNCCCRNSRVSVAVNVAVKATDGCISPRDTAIGNQDNFDSYLEPTVGLEPTICCLQNISDTVADARPASPMPMNRRSVAPMRPPQLAEHRPSWRQRWRHSCLPT
jgi:hypothetical protein